MMAHLILVLLWVINIIICFIRTYEIPVLMQVACMIVGWVIISDFIQTKKDERKLSKKKQGY